MKDHQMFDNISHYFDLKVETCGANRNIACVTPCEQYKP